MSGADRSVERFTVPPFNNWQDLQEFRVDQWIGRLTPLDDPDAIIIGAPFTSGNTKPTGSWQAPEAIRSAFRDYTTYSADFDIDLAPLVVRDAGDVLVHATSSAESLQRISDVVVDLLTRHQSATLVALGGDHSITAATIPAYGQARPMERLGLIYFDAHTDVRPEQEGVALAGSPVRHALEKSSNLAGSNVVEVGIHGFMNALPHRRWAEAEGIAVYSARQVGQRGLQVVLDEALRKAGDGTDAIYVSVDVDVLDLPYGLGAGGRISPGGMSASDLLEAMWLLGQQPSVRMLDVVEVDPSKDVARATTRVAASLILTFFGGLLARQGIPAQP